MRERLNNLFIGRQGMDELSKFLFWSGMVSFFLSCIIKWSVSSFFSGLGITLLAFSFIRAFSRKLERRELENNLFLMRVDKRKRSLAARKERFAQRKQYKFFKCPGCGTVVRVPRGKGKIHISCRCGYTLYRKT